jgi:putative membrane protein
MNNYWNDWYSGWGWFLWVGIFCLIFSSFGNWGYTYQAHRRYRDSSANKDAVDMLNERYARGEIQRNEFHKMKEEIQTLRVLYDKRFSKNRSAFTSVTSTT